MVFKILCYSILMMAILGVVSNSRAKSAHQPITGDSTISPQPPAKNPHPPTSPEEKRRVHFALSAIKISLTQDLPVPALAVPPTFDPFSSKDLNCLKNISCLLKDERFAQEIKTLVDIKGKMIEFRHPHVIPWSYQRYLQLKNVIQSRNRNTDVKSGFAKNEDMEFPNSRGPILNDDEYMVHVYVRFKNDKRWHHLDVILTEDDQGNPLLRHFYTIPIPEYPNQLPPGVDC